MPGHGKHLAILHADTIPNVMCIRLVNKSDVICPWDVHIDYIGCIGTLVIEKMSLKKPKLKITLLCELKDFSLLISKKNQEYLRGQGGKCLC